MDTFIGHWIDRSGGFNNGRPFDIAKLLFGESQVHSTANFAVRSTLSGGFELVEMDIDGREFRYALSVGPDRTLSVSGDNGDNFVLHVATATVWKSPEATMLVDI